MRRLQLLTVIVALSTLGACSDANATSPLSCLEQRVDTVSRQVMPDSLVEVRFQVTHNVPCGAKPGWGVEF